MLQNNHRQMFMQPLVVTKSPFLLAILNVGAGAQKKNMQKSHKIGSTVSMAYWLTTGERKNNFV